MDPRPGSDRPRPDQERLRKALAGRYDVGAIVGAGGMATVFRATDLKHQREVAIKVLRPELSAMLGTERFLREIEILAGLQHPRILPLYDSGEADGLLYYVMPLVDGESLRNRLDREGKLPLPEALRITREVAAALSFAHRRGIVHRDIKPDNILLSGGEAVVADFGIARVVDAAGASRITATGVAVGSPAYMSPDQISGGGDPNEQSDIYSLGCLLYEMIAGRPPYAADNAQGLAMQHLAAPIPHVTTAEPGIPPVVDDAIQRALAKEPADRFGTVTEFVELLGFPDGASGPIVFPPRRRPWRSGAAIAGAALVAAVGLFVVLPPRATPVENDLLTVLPFRVSGDSSVGFLREGMVDLLTSQLGSMSGVRALDSRTVLAAWRRRVPDGSDPSTEEARALASDLGSGRLLLGEIVGTSVGLSITARILTAGGDPLADATVQGPLDSLIRLVDRLSSQLLARSAGEPPRRLTSLTSTSLPATRAYLAGRAAYRSGELANAVAHFTEALEYDSAFALAALGMASAGAWSQQASQSAALRRGLRTGYALRDRLSQRDRLLFEAYVLPSSSGSHTSAQQLAGWRRAVEGAPESAEAQYEYGDRLYHSGAHVGVEDALAKAEAAFARSLALDSTFAPPLAHLLEIAARAGDRPMTRQLDVLYRADLADASDYVRWRVAIALGDERTLSGVRGRWEELTVPAINRMIGFGQVDVSPLTDVDLAAAELRRRVDSRFPVPGVVPPGLTLHSWALNRGRRSSAAHAVRVLAQEDPRPPGSSIVFFDAYQLPVLDAMFWDGDSAAAREAVSRLERRVAGPFPTESGAIAQYYTNLCVLGLWGMTPGQGGDVVDILNRLRVGGATRDSAIVHGADPMLCVTMLEAMTATARGSDRASDLVTRLDSILVTGPYVFGSDFGNLVLGSLLEAAGDPVAALRAIRRRPYDWDTNPLYFTTYLREEGRLAALTGDSAGARAAYERYLALREGADPVYQTGMAEVRRALDDLR